MTDIKHFNQVDLSRWLGLGPKFIKIGGSVKYRLADIEHYEQSRLCQSTADQHCFDRSKEGVA